MGRRSVAIVVPAVTSEGGVPSVARFLHESFGRVGTYHSDLISVATSASDSASARFLRPLSFIRGPRVEDGVWHGHRFRHVGAWGTEIELQRYQPRRVLDEILRQYDIIQVVSGTPAFAHVALACGRPVCAFVATRIVPERQNVLAQTTGLRGLWLRWMTTLNVRVEHAVLPRLTHVFAESEYTRELVQTEVAPERLSLGIPGVDCDHFSPGRYQPDSYILSVGRFRDPRKNVGMLIRAYHQLRQRMPDAPRLVLAGKSTPSPANVELARTLGVLEYIEVREGVSWDELADLYRKAALFVLSSDEEGLGIVILEAMASGLPVVSTDSGGPRTVLRDGVTGYLVPVGDAAAFAERMHVLLERPEMRTTMGAEGRRSVEARFSLEGAAQAYLRTYDAILNRERGEHDTPEVLTPDGTSTNSQT